MELKGKAHGSNVKLPTFRLWLRDNPVTSDMTTFAIEKILWSDKYRTITFFTKEFRYSYKCSDEQDLIDTCGMILDSFESQPDGYLHAAPLMRYESETGDVVLTFDSHVTEHGTCLLWKQFEWGLVITGTGDYTPKAKPKTKRRSSSG